MNVVLIPCFNRPEFLWHTLDNIQKAEGAARYTYLFRLDHGYDKDNLKVIEAFPFTKEVSFTPRTNYTLGKQSYSLLTGLQMAKGDKVFLIEDDVIIGRDFFQWHEEVHSKHDLFSSHANLNINSTGPKGLFHQYYLTSGDYGSIGTCLSRAALDMIEPHITDAYFRKPVEYIRKHFVRSWLSDNYAEQDGLIRRIQKASRLPQAYPCQMELDGLSYGPRCFHAGFTGKNRQQVHIPGTLEERIRQVGEVIYDQWNMQRLCGPLFADSRPVCLHLPPFDGLERVGQEV